MAINRKIFLLLHVHQRVYVDVASLYLTQGEPEVSADVRVLLETGFHHSIELVVLVFAVGEREGNYWDQD